MNLFQLVAQITLDSKDFEEGVNGSKEKFGKFSAWTVAKGALIAKGIEAGTKALIGFGKSAVSGYAEYEQLVGGVETLFGAGGKSLEEYAASVGKSVDKAKEEYEHLKLSEKIVMENADKAFSTAGMSANEYMETVTGFSASLIQSLGGDTLKAAKLSDQALVDMADNANKMGTSLESIRFAYGGFAKQNYTMLDNLKLGYGGTKSEMERLIKDAAKLDKSIDANSLSFGNIVKAIHVVQTEMGITGTTSLEAAETISGSVGSVRAAWENLKVGIADENADITTLIDNFIVSAETSFSNLLPRIEQVIYGAGHLVEGLLPPVLAKGLQIIIDTMPKLLEAGGRLIMTLGKGILAAIPQFTEKLPKIVTSFGTFISENLPHFLDMGISILIELGKGLINALPSLLLVAGEIIDNLFDYLVNLVGRFFEVGWELVKQLWNGLKEKWADFKDGFTADWNTLIDDVKEIVKGFFNVGKNVIEQIKHGIADAWDGLKHWFNNRWNSLFGNRNVNVNVNYDEDAEKDGYHRAGLKAVPFDGYMAELHKGERVLTANEAKRYDEGGRNIVINQYIEAVPQSPIEIAAATQSYFEEARWAF